MRVEEIALRQEARQMLCEAGFDKENLRELVLKDMDEKVVKAIEGKIKGVDFEQMILNRADKALTKAVDDIVRKYVDGYFYNRKLNIHATASFDGQPTVKTVNDGEWLSLDTNLIEGYNCSVCGHIIYMTEHGQKIRTKYCSNCGAKMKEQ